MSPGSDEVEGYRLRWKNHQTTLVRSLFSEKSFVDVTLSAEGNSIDVHRLILSACSPFFKDILQQHSDIPACVIVLKDVPFAQLQTLVEFMYRGEVSVAPEQLPSLLQTAEWLQIKGLTDSVALDKMNGGVEVRKNNELLEEEERNKSTEISKQSSEPAAALTTQPSIMPYPILGTTTSSITQMLHQPIYTSNLLPQANVITVLNNGESFDVGGNSKIERDRGPSSASVATSNTVTTSPENEEWSDADLGTGGPPTPAGAPAVEVVLHQHHQPFTVGATAFPHVSWGESLAAAAAAVVSSAVGSLVPGPSGIHPYLHQAAAAAASVSAATTTAAPVGAAPPTNPPSRGKQRNNRRNARTPSVATLVQEKPYVCQRCSRCYSRRGALIQHQRYECGIEPQFSCPMCPYKIKRKDSLNRHIRNMHHNHQSN